MWFRRPSILAVLLLAACGGSTGPSAPPQTTARFGTISGNKQTVTAGVSVKLPENVAVQVVATAAGVALRPLTPLEVLAVRTQSALATVFLPPRAFAQISVQGIPNQVVCFGSLDPKHALHAEVPCATSDANGLAFFVAHSDSVSGVSRADISAALPTGTKITDSVTATVMPGAPFEISFWLGVGTSTLTVPAGVPLDLHRRILYVGDRFHNFIAPDSLTHISPNGLADTTTTFTPGWALRDGTDGADPTGPDSVGWMLTPRQNPTGRSLKENGSYRATMNLYVFGGKTILAIVAVKLQ